jgi:hypothetical protein
MGSLWAELYLITITETDNMNGTPSTIKMDFGKLKHSRAHLM